MTLYEQLSKLIQDTNDVTWNPLLQAIDRDFIKELESETPTDQNIAKIISEMLNFINNAKIQDIDNLKNFYAKYGEAKYYKALKDRLTISVIPEKKKNDTSTPDFKIEDGGKIFYAEVKSFLMSGGNTKYTNIQKDSLDAKIDAENQIKSGKSVAISEQTIRPHLKNEQSYDSHSTKIVIETLIAKFDQNYKDEQYDMGDTISFIYLNDYNFPLHNSKIVPFYIDCKNGTLSLLSGELWTAVFGKIGMPVFKYADFEGEKSRDVDLSDDGILIKHSKPKAVCFYIEGLNHHGNIVTLIRFGEKNEIKDLISKITDLYNDDQNSRFYRLIS